MYNVIIYEDTKGKSEVKEYIENVQEQKKQREAQRLAEEKAAQEAEIAAETVPHIERSNNLGTADFDAEPIFLPQEDSIYTFMLDTSIGPMLYYCQGDIRWKNYLYGGIDPISRYGCGPTCVAMVINSFSSTSVTPIEMADWAAANGEFAKHGGSYHSLIPNSLSAFVKEQIEENGDVLPEWLDGLVKVFEKTSVSLRKAAK